MRAYHYSLIQYHHPNWERINLGIAVESASAPGTEVACTFDLETAEQKAEMIWGEIGEDLRSVWDRVRGHIARDIAADGLDAVAGRYTLSVRFTRPLAAMGESAESVLADLISAHLSLGGVRRAGP